MALSDSFLRQIESLSNAPKLLETFNETFKSSAESLMYAYLISKTDKYAYVSSAMFELKSFHLFLCTAFEYNHTELVRLLVHDSRSRVLEPHNHETFMKCLFNAIHAGNVELVEIILRFGLESPLDVLRGYRCRRLNDYKFVRYSFHPLKKREYLSAIEYACLRDQHEMLKLLVAYDLAHKREIVNPAVPVHDWLDEYVPVSALYAVIELMGITKFGHLLTLPANVQFIVDMTSDDDNGLIRFTALECLISVVSNLFNQMIEVSTEECRIIVEIAQILLGTTSSGKEPVTAGPEKQPVATGSDNDPAKTGLEKQLIATDRSQDQATTGPGNQPVTKDSKTELVTIAQVKERVLTTLLGLMFRRITLVNYANDCLKLVSDLVKLLLKHGPMQVQEGKNTFKYTEFLSAMIDCVSEYRYVTDARPTHREMLRNILDHVADIFYYVTLVVDIVDYYLGVMKRRLSLEEFVRMNLFVKAFVYIAGYSSEPGGSDKYIRVILDCMNAYQISQVKMRLEHMDTTNESHFCKLDLFKTSNDRVFYPEYVQTALELVGKVEARLLLHLSRRAITRAMSNRCLNEEHVNVATLGLPKNLQGDVFPYIK